MAGTRRFTGWHMATIMIAFFGVVISVNLIMARYASSTFGGVVVENSYVASQKFNTWLDAAEKQKALGWSAKAERQLDGRVAVTMAGMPTEEGTLDATARHPLGRLDDQTLIFSRAADGRFLSDKPLPSGRWILRLEAKAQGKTWREERDI